MGMINLKPEEISKAGKDRGCYILKKLCEMWQCEPVNACGAVGCFYCESTCDPALYNKAEKNGTFKGSAANGEGYGAGIAQWSLTWKKNIQTHFNNFSPIETWSMDQLIAIILHTCKDKFINLLKLCNTAADSTDIWLRGYENGGGGNGALCKKEFIDKYTWCNGYAGAMSGRTTAAYEILKAYLGGNIGEDVRGDIASTPNYSGSNSTSSSVSNSSGIANSVSGGVLNTNGASNIYGGLTSDTSTNNVKHTRIYEAFPSTLKLNTMEMNLDGSASPVDSSINVDSSTGDTSEKTIELVLQRTSGVGNESLLAAGVAYPVIRINDYYVVSESIDKFVIATTGFVPTVELVFASKDKELMKGNAIKDGDIMSVFVAPSQAAFKSLRCDFLITAFIAPTMSLNRLNATYTYRIYGELYVSNLYNANLTFSYAGSSRDALMHAAEQLKLGFFFNDPENTDDSQMWYCTSPADIDNPEENRPSNMKKFILETTLHAWKNFESFFDSWIDIRYGLTFLNINKQLGEEGADEEIDFTPWQSAITNSRQIEGHRANLTPDEDKNEQSKGASKPAFKLISNIIEDESNTNTYFCVNYEVINQSGEISREMGVNIQTNYVVNNHGVDLSNNDITMNFSIPYNEWKMQNGYYMLIGPGKNESYTPGDSYDEYVSSNTVKAGGQTSDIQADSDANTVVLTGNNMLSTGNVNKFYDAAEEHNRINNLQLQKKYVNFTLNGANFGIMRGEKIPAMILNISLLTNALNNKGNSEDILISNYIEEDLSGWFIIDGIKYIYNAKNPEYSTAWKTEVKCIRREWPISGKSVYKAPTEQNNTLNTPINTINPNADNVVTDSSSSSATNNMNNTNNTLLTDTTIAGLESYMVELWNALKAASVDKATVTLVLGRWYAVDENGLKTDGYPYIINGGLYKVMDEKGAIRYINTTTWEHFFGRAINVSTSCDIAEYVQKCIMASPTVLDIMFKNGISCYEEIWKSGVVEAKTLHFGTSTTKQKEWWNMVFLANPEYKSKYAAYLGYNFYSTLPDKTKQNINESSLKKDN